VQGPAIVTGGELAVGVRRGGPRRIGRDRDERTQLVVSARDVRETGIGERALSSGATMVYEGLSSAERAMRQRQTTKKDKP